MPIKKAARRLPVHLITIAALAGSIASAGAADWPQWRGPHRDGVAPSSPRLAEAWPSNGLVAVWKSEKIPSGEDGNLSSPVVAGGRVFVHVTWRERVPIATRKLAESGLRNLGWRPEKLPSELSKQVEAARVSDERAKVPGNELGKWMDDWIAQRVSTNDLKNLGPIVKDRLNLGGSALPLESLEKLATIKNQEFAGTEAIEKWLAENGIAENAKKAVLAQIPTSQDIVKDVVVCLNAKDGKTLWKAEFPGRAAGYSYSGTPCVDGRRLYVLGSQRTVYCLDTTDGKLIWKTLAPQGESISSSFMVAGELAVILAGPLTAFDVKTGDVKWTQPKVSGSNPSPVLWKHKRQLFAICNTAGQIGCVDLQTGQVRWTMPGGSSSTTAVNGDCLAVFSDRSDVGLTMYKLAPEKAEKAWIVDIKDRGASPIIYEGHVYVIGGGGSARALCADLQTGKAAWDEKIGNQEIGSPILADDKLIALVDNYTSLGMWRASPEKYELLAKVRVPAATCTSPAFADGKLYLRLNDGVACYDLTR